VTGSNLDVNFKVTYEIVAKRMSHKTTMLFDLNVTSATKSIVGNVNLS
jgi:hypothetical protein